MAQIFFKEFDTSTNITLAVQAIGRSENLSNAQETFTLSGVSSVEIEDSMVFFAGTKVVVKRSGAEMSENEYHTNLSDSVLTAGIRARYRVINGKKGFFVKCPSKNALYIYLITLGYGQTSKHYGLVAGRFADL